jgi:hypothetical protein
MFSQTVAMPDGTDYTVRKLLANGKANTKTAKSDKAGVGYLTSSLSLAPASASGFNLCSSASHACIKGCLFTSGFAAIHPRTILPARIAKSRWLRLAPLDFKARLHKELTDTQRTATRKGFKLAVRLNVYSDVMWEREFPTLFTDFPEIQFYDYTKHYKRMLRYIDGTFPTNYQLTFSWSGENEHQCRTVLEAANVAVPFHVKYRGEQRQPLPAKFQGYEVIDGDVTDLRFLDPQGSKVVGLRVKGRAKKDFNSGFVISVA